MTIAQNLQSTHLAYYEKPQQHIFKLIVFILIFFF